MPPAVKVGAILFEEWPLVAQLDDLESEPYSGHWKLVKVLDGFALGQKIRAFGWNFFFMGGEVRAMFFGASGEKKICGAVKRILRKVKELHFNSLEITGIVAKRFLGVPYVVVSAHSRHIQQPCYLENTAIRRAAQRDAAWARG